MTALLFLVLFYLQSFFAYLITNYDPNLIKSINIFVYLLRMFFGGGFPFGFGHHPCKASSIQLNKKKNKTKNNHFTIFWAYLKMHLLSKLKKNTSNLLRNLGQEVSNKMLIR